MNSSNSMHKLDMIPEFEITSTITKIDDICSNDIGNNISNNVNCKYFINEEFSNLPKTKNVFNIFHANVNGIENHFEDLETVLVDSNRHFNAMCISETTQKENTMFCKNVDLKNNHTPISTGTKTAKGGTAIYVLKNHDLIERYDLNTSDIEYESTWVEIKNKKSKNIIIGCIYRHPHYNNLEEFTHYMKNTLLKLNKEKKEIYICGDFNVNLLKYDEDIVVQKFYNLMTSHGFIPQIILPTRITDSSMNLIDNIYSNMFSNNTFGGNIIIEIADHLLQFVSIDSSKIEYNKRTCYKRNYLKFSEESFIADTTRQK